jgi:hydrogenase nickel incorporation protein HypA/HybF
MWDGTIRVAGFGPARSAGSLADMHELPVTEGILQVALEAADQVGARRITAINLVIGELASIVDDSVQFYFDFLSRETPAAGAVLHFKRESASGLCLDCGFCFDVVPPVMPFCPGCNSSRLQVSGGREFFVESIEVEN